MKAIGGDFGQNRTGFIKTTFFGRFKYIAVRRLFWRKYKIRRKDIVGVKQVSDQNKAAVLGAVGGGLVGSFLAGSVGMLAGSLLGGRGKSYVLLIQHRNGKRLLCVVNQKEFELIAAATVQLL